MNYDRERNWKNFLRQNAIEESMSATRFRRDSYVSEHLGIDLCVQVK